MAKIEIRTQMNEQKEDRFFGCCYNFNRYWSILKTRLKKRKENIENRKEDLIS